MRKTIFLLMAVSLSFFVLTSCSKDDDDDNGGSGSPARNDPGKLAVTGNVTDITALGATISGWANIDPAHAAVAKFGIIVSGDPKPSYSNGMLYSANKLNQDNSYQVEVTDLTPGTKYYYLSYVRIGDIYNYGEVRSFSTKEFPKDMAVTGNVTDITAIGATISGWANIDPALAMAAKFGVIVSEDPKPSYSNGMLYSANELNQDNSYQVSVKGFTPGTTYYYVSYVWIGDIYIYGEVRSFSTKEVHSCPDKRHPHAIDLGLPSGTKWACCNVGATTPEGYGGYYAWGETSEKSVYNWDTYKWCNGSFDSLTKYCTDPQYGNVDGKTVLDLSDDVAHVRMGGSWRMPTYEQIKELKDNCTATWTQQNGVNGIIVTGPSGGQIFLPAAGSRWDDGLNGEGSNGSYGWSSSLSPYLDYGTYYLGFYLGNWDWYGCDRSNGLSVRAVCQ